MKRLTLILLFFIVLSGCYYLLTMKRSAEAIIEISPFGKMGSSHKGSSSSRMTRSYFQTQFSIVRNEKVVSRAIDDYRLDTLFETNKETLLKQIIENINTKQQKGTDLIFIKAFSDTEEKAQQICYAIVHTYDELRREGIENTRNEVIKKYKQKIKSQEEKVAINKKRLIKLYESLGIPLDGQNNNLELQTSEPMIIDDKTSYGKVTNEYEREFQILQSIKSAEFSETIVSGLEIDPIQINEPGWTPEIEKMMLARKLKKK